MNVADAMDLNHSAALNRSSFTVTILRTFCYFFLTPLFQWECKGKDLLSNRKIVFQIVLKNFVRHYHLKRTFTTPFSFWERKDREGLQTAKFILIYFRT
jgi:hypothetical protein